MEIKQKLKKFWKFIWEDDSLLSWIINVILAFIIVKFIIYPLLGLLLGTSYPVVAVVSSSMEHNSQPFYEWWTTKSQEYKQYNITADTFQKYKFIDGFNKGDIMVLTSPKNIKTGEVIVFWGSAGAPIIHRVVKTYSENGITYYQTRGDNNLGSRTDEMRISKEKILGKANIRIPYLGWFKLAFVNLFSLLYQ